MQVTVAIPSYNHGRYVEQAIESVLDQGWPDLDLIVLDDGSRDGSPEVIRRLHERRGGFRFVARENRGLIATLNELLQLAQGEAFCLLASDDYLPPGSLAARADFLQAQPEHVAVFGDGLVLTEATGTSEPILDAKRRRLFDLADPIPEFLRGVNLPIHTMLARTAVLRRLGGIDRRYRRCEDLELQPRLFLEGKVGFVDLPVYCYRRHETNISAVNPQVARIDKVLCFRKFLEELPPMAPYRGLIRQRLRRHYLLLGRYLAQKGGGEGWEREIFRGGWEFWWQDPRLLWYLLRLGGSRQHQARA
jgi:alpha-1,3-rhamnosyltransferase